MTEETVHQVEQIIGYRFANRRLLETALTHSSAVDNRLDSNERLEFLGDAILGQVICQALFERFEQYFEGDLTKIKSTLVSRRTCAKITKKMGLHPFLRVGKGMSSIRNMPGSVIAGMLEAVIAAIYLDSDFAGSRDFIGRIFGPLIDQADAAQSGGNFKSVLQQHSQKNFGITPLYELVDERGPDNNKCFESQVVIAERRFPSAWGTNKKQAEQKAAFNALRELGLLEETAHEIDD